MFQLTNEQRRCFGLLPIEDHWVPMVLKPSPYHKHTTTAFLDGTVLRKVIMSGDDLYTEREICEELSEDLKYILPKTEKGKPVLLSAASLEKKGHFGMSLQWGRDRNRSGHIFLYSADSQRNYYSSSYENLFMPEPEAFTQWVANWCRETTENDLKDLAAFVTLPRQHVKFKEGDVFRFKINRRLWGYGRVLVDYARMRKEKTPFWDILMGKPVVCSVYHIATERSDLTPEELRGLPSLPSCNIMDNHLFYGEFEIIGNLPIREREDYPILYGGSLSNSRRTSLQCGKLFLSHEGEGAFPYQFRNNGIGFNLNFSLTVLLQCIEAGSNAPYWAQDNGYTWGDLRCPRYRAELETVCREFNLEASQLLVENP